MTHICVGNLIGIGSDNGLSPGRRQAIIWTNAGILLIGLLGTNFCSNSRMGSNYIFILDLTPGFNGLGKDKYKTRRYPFKLWDLIRLILEIWRYLPHKSSSLDAFTSAVAIPDEVNCSWLHQSHHCVIGIPMLVRHHVYPNEYYHCHWIRSYQCWVKQPP